MAERKFTSNEVQLLQQSLSSDNKACDIRLREGEYPCDLAKAIASFQLGLRFPDVKETIERSYGVDKTTDIQFVRKIQTILKKMEKGKVVIILKKKNPWELQRYALSSFKFEDADRSLVVLATDQQIKQSQESLESLLRSEGSLISNPNYVTAKIGASALLVAAAYVVAVWALIQPIIDPLIFVAAFSVAVLCSLVLGKMLRPRPRHLSSA